MDRFYLFDASPCPSATMVRVPAYSSTPERAAASQMTAFTAVLQAHTGQFFHNFAALHDYPVRDYRTFWQCFPQWSPLPSKIAGYR